jgi:hypothetical protein
MIFLISTSGIEPSPFECKARALPLDNPFRTIFSIYGGNELYGAVAKASVIALQTHWFRITPPSKSFCTKKENLFFLNDMGLKFFLDINFFTVSGHFDPKFHGEQ